MSTEPSDISETPPPTLAEPMSVAPAESKPDAGVIEPNPPVASQTAAEQTGPGGATLATAQPADAALASAGAEPQPGSKAAARGKSRVNQVMPVLQKLFELYPHLFGEHFLPLKLGIYQDLLAAQPQAFKRDELKGALGVHTRSSRYLQAVASGMRRHDLQGRAVEEVAPEHVFLAIAELFQRRQARSKEDLRPRLKAQLLRAIEKSGLSRQDYLARISTPADVIQPVLDDALAEVEQQRARRAALLRSFEASGKSVEEFADMLGIAVTEIKAALKQRRQP